MADVRVRATPEQLQNAGNTHGPRTELRTVFGQLGARIRRRELGHLLVAGHQRADPGRPGADDAQPDVRPADPQLHRLPGGQRLRDARGERRHRAAGAVPVVAARRPPQHHRAEQERGRAEGARDSVLPQRQLPRAVRHPRVAQVHEGIAREAPGDVAGGALPGGREVARESARAGRQVPRAEEVPAAEDDLGRRAEDALLQGAHQEPVARVVPAGPVPQPDEEAGAGASHGVDADTGRELVQESTAKGQGGRSQEQVGQCIFIVAGGVGLCL